MVAKKPKRKVKKTNHLFNALMTALAGAELGSGALSQIVGPKGVALIMMLWPIVQSVLAEYTDRTEPKAAP